MGGIDAITLQVLGSAFRSICEEMGAALVRASYSTNIKERRDCSTALFDAEGRLVAQAEHIPIHLGAMPDAVAAVMGQWPRPGDTYILNDPFSGGTHLPDITLVSAIDVRGRIIGYAASRAHHSDVGGSEPGSMPADSTSLEEEGVVIPPTLLVAEGELQEEFLSGLLAKVRRPEERRGDLRAQLGAADIARRRLGELVVRHGLDTVLEGMGASIDYAERRMRAAIEALPDGTYKAEDYLEREEEDLVIAVSVSVLGPELFINFMGTSPQEEGNLNCPMAVTRSACYYALRVVTDEDIPANAGALAPVQITAPEGSLVNARAPAAVVAGNVEASQRIADTVLLALGRAIDLPAQGQGTMNNLTLGNEYFNYYETIGGGAGACPGSDGASGIHLGTTNTMNTPVEALEMAFPLRVGRYEFRRGSGGDGRYRGGDGLVRSLTLLTSARLSLLCDRRRHGPRGAAGGLPGLPGRNLVNGKEVGAKVTLDVESADVVTIETPGGGGYGEPSAGDGGRGDAAAAAAGGRSGGGDAGDDGARAVVPEAQRDSFSNRHLRGEGMKRLAVAALLLFLAADVLMQVLFFKTYLSSNESLAWLFHLDREHNVPSIYSTLKLVLAAVAIYGCVKIDEKRQVGRMHLNHLWLILGTIVLFMAMDEFFAIHERADYFIWDLYLTWPALEQLGGYGWPWTVAGMVLVLVVGIPATYYTYRAFSNQRNLFFLLVLAGAMFIGAAIGLEDLGVYLDNFYAGEGTTAVMMLEEFLEMCSVTLVIFIFMRYRGVRTLISTRRG